MAPAALAGEAVCCARALLIRYALCSDSTMSQADTVLLWENAAGLSSSACQPLCRIDCACYNGMLFTWCLLPWLASLSAA